MLNVGDTHKVSPVLDWPSTLDADVASPWNQSDPFIDRSAITRNAEVQICNERGTLVGLGPQLPIAESVPSSWTLARRLLMVWLAMVFALHVVCAVGPPERDGNEPKADVSSAAWEARRRY